MTTASSPPGALSPLVRIFSDDRAGFTAQVVGLPEIQATAPTREEAIESVRSTLVAWLAAGELVRLDVPASNNLGGWFGWAKNDPEYDDFREEVRRQREALDESA